MSFKEGFGENGNLPDNKLMSVGGEFRLYAPAAKSYLKMKAAAAEQGITFKLNSAYRKCGKKGDYTERQCNTGFTQFCAYEKYKAGSGNLASNPTTSVGCKSNHGFGLAIDLSPTSAQKWVVSNGEQFGWVWTGKNFSQVENWHFDYFQDKDKFYTKNQIGQPNDKSENGITLPIIIAAGVFIVAAYTLYYFTRPDKN